MAKTLVLVAGEASGDLHAAHLVCELKSLSPDTRFFGLGGPRMKAAGVELYHDMTDLAVVGFIEVLKNYKTFKKIFDDLLARIDALRPDAVVLVDYPGFNLRLARELKKRNIPIVYYISPQVWAWGRERIAFIRSHIDLMLVLFKFEETLYKNGTFNVKFVGHPLLDTVKPTTPREEFLKKTGFKTNARTFALLPGSRHREVTALMPIMLDAANRIYRHRPDAQFLICRASTIPRQKIKDILETTKPEFPYSIIDDDTYNAVNAADMVVVASGTATLETAILNKPMVIVYKVTFGTWLLAKLFIKIPYVGLVNVVARRKIVPELLQFDATPQKIFETAIGFLEKKDLLEQVHTELYALKNTLGIPGASRRAAEEIVRFLAAPR
jgi:lipid-A-disaccharide synthase